MDKDPRVIGARIARRRHQLDWSQVELARRLDVSPSTVANWERGVSYPKKKWGKVEEVLGISLDAAGQPEPEPELPPSLLADIYKTFPDEESRRRAFSLFRRALASGLPGLPETSAPAERQRRRAG